MAAVNLNSNSHEEECVPVKKGKKLPSGEYFTLWDTFLVVLSLCTFSADVGTDVVVMIHYAMEGRWLWTILTCTFVMVSTVTVNFFSLRWHIEDAQDRKAPVGRNIWLVNIFQFGIIHRYFKVLRMGFEDRHDKAHKLIGQIRMEQCDLCMLRLFDSFLESAPQLILQLYIMVSSEGWNTLTGVAALASLVSLAWGVASYSRSLRDAAPNKPRVSWLGVFLQTMWRGGTLTSRIIAIVLCVAVLKMWFLLIMFFHWLAMTVWLIQQKTDFCPSWWEEMIYNCVVGVIYCFCYFNVKENKSRFRATAFYTLILVENVCFVVLDYSLDPNMYLWYFPGSFFVVVGSFLIGITSMVVYYCCCHPSGRVYTCYLFPFPRFKKMLPATSIDAVPPTDFTTFRTLKYIFPSHLHPKETAKFYTSISPKSPLEYSNTEGEKMQRQTTSLDVSFLPCMLSDHRSHSEDCLVPQQQSSARKSKANHHHAVNYSFRPLAAHGQTVDSSIHCSCLILYDNEHDQFLKRTP